MSDENPEYAMFSGAEMEQRMGMPVGAYLDLTAELSDVEFVDAADVVIRLRMNKSEEELETFVAWVLRNAEPVVTASEGLRAVEIIEAAYRSIRERDASRFRSPTDPDVAVDRAAPEGVNHTVRTLAALASARDRPVDALCDERSQSSS